VPAYGPALLATLLVLGGDPVAADTPVAPAPPACSVDPVPGYEWDWRYPAPTCDGLTITFPDDLPESQQGVIEVNVRHSHGTLQYKLEGEAYRAAFPDGHAGLTVVLPWSAFRGDQPPASGTWTVEWVQVHGSNYHWEGAVACGEPETPGGPTDPPVDPGDPGDPGVDPGDPTDPGVDPTDPPVDPGDPAPFPPTDPGTPGGGPVLPGPGDPGAGGGLAVVPAPADPAADAGDDASEVLAADPGDAADLPPLAVTGSPAGAVLTVAGGLLALGAALVLAARRTPAPAAARAHRRR
jgi:hypothetical protein